MAAMTSGAPTTTSTYGPVRSEPKRERRRPAWTGGATSRGNGGREPPQDLVRHLRRRERPAEIARAAAFGDRAVHRVLDELRLRGEAERVAQHHRGREDRADRVRDPLSHDVRRGAVDRLVEPRPLLADRRR